jgi:hypothetical protein
MMTAKSNTEARGANLDGNKLNPDKAPKTEVSKKKPYTKPAFRFERVFETQALSCGKVFTSQGSCKFNRKAS